ncbi:hypothetical protein PsorP6_001150 [Peronosclerospora sorghi]|uniref:Uncharacterized protein n=1 Tax=Peronosclerospora sorghi TaxID=230839 RepID=A0ACC0WXZ0_9STRA|nr:hypothetical protein PsorP6_001150 [Peronosclerospora sorghi]
MSVPESHSSTFTVLQGSHYSTFLLLINGYRNTLDMGIAFQTIGMLGSFVIASSLVPQMMKVYKTKSAKDISLRFQILYCFGIGLILIYGLGENLWPIYIPASVEEVAGLVMLAMKLYYDRDDNSKLPEVNASPLSQQSETKFTGVKQTP